MELAKLEAQALGTELEVFANLKDLADRDAKRIAKRIGMKLRDVYTLFLSPDAAKASWPWAFGS